MRAIEFIEAFGHKNITAKNRTTFEVTKDDYLTKRGDCIIAINATKGVIDLSTKFKDLARQKNAMIMAVVKVENFKVTAKGWGSPSLTFAHPTDLVIRKSNFLCDRTLMINSDKTAKDFPREMMQLLRSPEQKVKVKLIVEI